MKNIIVPVVSLLLATTAIVGNEKIIAPESSKLKVVQEFVAAFNSHDVDGMMKLVSEDVEWLNIKGNEVDLQTVGRSATRAAMKGYFASTPTVKSLIVRSMVAGSFVSIQERVSWKQGSRDASQASLAVYHIQKGLIDRVWYYPAE